MTNPFGRKARLMLGIVLCLLAAPTLADPPARVGRVAVAEGRVEFLPEAGGAAVASPLNYPVLAESRLRTGDDGHAEVQLGNTTVWLAPGTALGFTGLDEDVLDLELTEGDLALRVHESPGYGPLQLRTLPADVSIGAEGRYRITTDTVSTQVIVHEGLARVTAGDEVAYVSAGKTLVASRGGIVSHAVSGRGVGPDGDPFERWVSARDIDSPRNAPRYVSSGMPGWQDLDAHGYWEESAEYGPVWTPAVVPPGWSPFHDGRWVWLEPWGWTWIDHAPWGFAPSHFGRWVTLRDRWYWSPGHIVERPVFAPAVVVFIGTTSVDRHFHRSRPPKKWAPLGPRERFVPPFRASSRFSERLNAPHVGAPRHFPGLPDARRVRDGDRDRDVRRFERDGDRARDVRRFERDDDRRKAKRSEPHRDRREFRDRRSDTPPSGPLGHPSRRFPTDDLVAPRAAPVPRMLEQRTREDNAAARRRLTPTTEPVPHLQRTPELRRERNADRSAERSAERKAERERRRDGVPSVDRRDSSRGPGPSWRDRSSERRFVSPGQSRSVEPRRRGGDGDRSTRRSQRIDNDSRPAAGFASDREKRSRQGRRVDDDKRPSGGFAGDRERRMRRNDG